MIYIVCVVFVTLLVFHVVLNGALVSVSSNTPSIKKRTRTTPTLSLAAAEMVTWPVTLAPAVGAVTETLVGATVSTDQLRLAGVASVLPAASVARTWKMCAPFAKRL
jgi:hypothetical protein